MLWSLPIVLNCIPLLRRVQQPLGELDVTRHSFRMTHKLKAFALFQIHANHIVPLSPHIVPRIGSLHHPQDDLVIEVASRITGVLTKDADAILGNHAEVVTYGNSSADAYRSSHALVIAVPTCQGKTQSRIAIGIAMNEEHTVSFFTNDVLLALKLVALRLHQPVGVFVQRFGKVRMTYSGIGVGIAGRGDLSKIVIRDLDASPVVPHLILTNPVISYKQTVLVIYFQRCCINHTFLLWFNGCGCFSSPFNNCLGRKGISPKAASAMLIQPDPCSLLPRYRHCHCFAV